MDKIFLVVYKFYLSTSWELRRVLFIHHLSLNLLGYSMGKLKGKVAAITGGNSGLGLAIAKKFKSEGASIAIMGRNTSTLKAAVEEIGADTLSSEGDVRSLSALDDFYHSISDRYGKVDIVIANAGGGKVKNIDEVDEEIFDEMTDSNWKGAYFTVQKALPLMESGGSIQLISSGANLKGFPSFSVYSGTKAAVRSLARCLASELAPRGIRVNCLSPGCIETPVWTKVGVPDDQVDSVKDYMIPFIPMARFGEPEEIATTSLFLASDESSYITGANIAADGGLAQV